MKYTLYSCLIISSISFFAAVPVQIQDPSQLSEIAAADSGKEVTSPELNLTDEEIAFLGGLYALKMLQQNEADLTDEVCRDLFRDMYDKGKYNFDAQDELGESLLMFCGKHGFIESARTLREIGVKTDLRDVNDYTAADFVYMLDSSKVWKRVPFIGASELEKICGWSDKGAEERTLIVIAGIVAVVSAKSAYSAHMKAVAKQDELAQSLGEAKSMLGLSGKVYDLKDIERRFRKASLRYHPDKPRGSTEAFQKLTEARELIEANLDAKSMPFLLDINA